MICGTLILGLVFAAACATPSEDQREKETPMAEATRTRPRQLGIPLGILDPGPLNAITDVDSVLVGQVSVRNGKRVNTGVTVVVPHRGDVFRDKVPGAIAVLNGFGKLTGVTQVRELGRIETPIALTNTLAVGTVTEALARWTLSRPGHESVRSVNAVVGETNDGFLNDIREAAVAAHHLEEAVFAARGGPVEEGTVGAGTGTVAFGWKGGIGTSSRRLPARLGGFTVGVLLQANFGGVLTVAGIPVGKELGPLPFDLHASADGSCMIIVATDAPLDARSLERLAMRTFLGLARVGSFASPGSGDYAIAFSTASTVRNGEAGLEGDLLSPLFLAAVEATEEAVLNALFMATPVDGHRGRVDALPIDRVLAILRRHSIVGA